MNRFHSRALLGGLVLALAACKESSTSPQVGSDLLSNALTTAVPGFDAAVSSYAADGVTATWVPGPGGPGRNGLGSGSLMGGGLGGEFSGSVGFGGRRGGHHGPFGLGARTCTGGTFASGRLTCPVETRNGLTINRSFSYANAAGTAQQAYDSATTNTINARVDVSGTTTFTADSGRGRDGRGHGKGFFGLGRGADSARITVSSATTTVRHASDQTVTGLASTSTQRTVNGTSAGTETTTGTSSAGTFTASRTQGDTTRGLIVPVSTTGSTYPTAGTVIRAMSATVTIAGGAAQTSTRREVLTYDGSATAQLTITQDGTTRTCTVALPRGRPSCS